MQSGLAARRRDVEGQVGGIRAARGTGEIATITAPPTLTEIAVARQVSEHCFLFMTHHLGIARTHVDQIAEEIANAAARDRRQTSTDMHPPNVCHETTTMARATETIAMAIESDVDRPRKLRLSTDTCPECPIQHHLRYL